MSIIFIDRPYSFHKLSLCTLPKVFLKSTKLGYRELGLHSNDCSLMFRNTKNEGFNQSINWLELDGLDFGAVSFYTFVNYNQFS